MSCRIQFPTVVYRGQTWTSYMQKDIELVEKKAPKFLAGQNNNNKVKCRCLLVRNMDAGRVEWHYCVCWWTFSEMVDYVCLWFKWTEWNIRLDIKCHSYSLFPEFLPYTLPLQVFNCKGFYYHGYYSSNIISEFHVAYLDVPRSICYK